MTAPVRSTARDLDGKVAVVVGGSRNMGTEFAVGLAARGATTVISYAGDYDQVLTATCAASSPSASAQPCATSPTEVATWCCRRP